jgi:integrase
VNNLQSNPIYGINLSLKQLFEQGGVTMKGSVYHRKDCPLCKWGDRRISHHPGWTISLYLPYLEKKYYKVTGPEKGKGFQNQFEAMKYLLEIQKAIEEKRYYPPAYYKEENSIFLFENYCRKWLENKNRDLKSVAKHYLPLHGKDIREINRTDIHRLYENLPDSLSQSYRNLILNTLHSILIDAWRNGYIEKIPPFPKRKTAIRREKKWLSWDEQMRVISCIPKKYKLLFLFMACHGVRPSEALRLRWEDIDYKRKVVTIKHTKTKKENTIPLHSEFLKAISVFKLSGNLFPQLTRRALLDILYKAFEKAGVKKVTLYEFSRHSFVSQRINAGCPADMVAMITSHDIGVMGRHYAHSNIQAKRRVIEWRD